MSVNRVVLIGRLGKDPETRQTNTGKTVTNFSLSVQKRIKPSDGSSDCDWFKIIAWGQTGEYVAKYLTRGRLCAVDGRLETRSWNDQEGNKREVVEIVADNVNGLDKPKDGGDSRSGQYDDE